MSLTATTQRQPTMPTRPMYFPLVAHVQPNLPFAVVDVETTGFSNRDRVLEVAVVHADPDGSVTSRWSTLVNPDRRIPNTHIHDIAADLADQLNGWVFVAHNAPFDTRLLSAEFGRLDAPAVELLERLWM